MKTPTQPESKSRIPHTPYPHVRPLRFVAQTAAVTTKSLFNGGALDSQVTDTQYLDGLMPPDSPDAATHGSESQWSPPPKQTMHKPLIPLAGGAQSLWLRVTSRENELVMLAREMVNDLESSRNEAWLYAEIARKGGKWDKRWNDKLKDELKAHGIKLPAFPVDDEEDFWVPE